MTVVMVIMIVITLMTTMTMLEWAEFQLYSENQTSDHFKQGLNYVILLNIAKSMRRSSYSIL